MSPKALIVASLTESPDEDRLATLTGQVDILEVRGDLVRDVEVGWLRSHFHGELLFTLRSREEGGRSDASPDRRRQRLLAAADHYDLVDLELQRDLSSELLSTVPARRRIVSWHGPPSSMATLQEFFGRMAETEARYYKLVPFAEQPRQEIAPLALLQALQRQDVIAFASGSIGSWTRLLAPRFGAPVVFAAAHTSPAAPGQLSVETLVEDYGLPDLPAAEDLFGLVGGAIEHSLSPRLHNGIYRQLGLPFLYLPFTVEAFGEFWLEVVESGAFEELGLRLRGLSVTAPHKTIASAVAGASSPLVEWLGSANTLMCREGVWEAESTDGEGILRPLHRRGIPIADRLAAVVGAGGAGRAAVVALLEAGARVTLVNRSVDHGRKAATELRVPYRSLEGFDPGEYGIIVHATPLGRQSDDPLLIDPGRLSRDTVVVDMVYLRSAPTRLVSEVRAMGGEAVDGREVLLYQAVPQFYLMTGQQLPVDVGSQLVGMELVD